MDRQLGLWIDHKQAYLIRNGAKKVEVIPSNVKRRAHFTGGARIGGAYNQNLDSELRHNDHYQLQLEKYYAQVIKTLQQADSILLMGPGEAKLEFKKEIQKHADLRSRLVKVEPADKMTINQMLAHVRLFYENLSNN
jgi:hypothetical protein